MVQTVAIAISLAGISNHNPSTVLRGVAHTSADSYAFETFHSPSVRRQSRGYERETSWHRVQLERAVDREHFDMIR